MNKLELHERISQAVQKFNLFSNVFMKVVFRDPLACQHVLRTLTGKHDLTIANVRTEYEIAKVNSHDSRLDVLAEDVDGGLYNIELQRESCLDHAKRVRFYHAMVDSEMLEKGKDYAALPNLSVFYISERDIWKRRQTSYSVEKALSIIAKPYEDGIRISYVNAEIDDHSDIAKLMKYFKTADPQDWSQGDLSKRIHFLKCEKEGRELMCKVTDELVEIGKEIGKEIGEQTGEERSIKRIVLRMAERGKSLSEIMDNTGVSLDMVRKWINDAAILTN